jgi:hypothetical protein
MAANVTLAHTGVGIVVVVQDVLLDIAEDRLGRVIIRDCLGHSGLAQSQPPRHLPRRCRSAQEFRDASLNDAPRFLDDGFQGLHRSSAREMDGDASMEIRDQPNPTEAVPP